MKLLGLSLVMMFLAASACTARAFVGSIDLREVSTPLKLAEDGFALQSEQFYHDFNRLMADSSLSWYGKSATSKQAALTVFLGRYKKALGSIDVAVSDISGMYHDRPGAHKQFAASELVRNVDSCVKSHKNMVKGLNQTLASFRRQGNLEVSKVMSSDTTLLSATEKAWSYRVKCIGRFISTVEKIFELEHTRLNGLIKGLM